MRLTTTSRLRFSDLLEEDQAQEVLLQVPRVQNDGRWPILSADTRHHFLMFIVDLAPRPSPRRARNTRGLALVDFTLPIDPMVPATRVFCANEVESRAPAETVIQATGCVGV